MSMGCKVNVRSEREKFTKILYIEDEILCINMRIRIWWLIALGLVILAVYSYASINNINEYLILYKS